MNKRIISLVLALVMVLGTFTSVFAAETNKDEKKAEAPKAGDKVEKIVGKDNKIQYIIDKKFVEGYEDGSYGYDKNIKRAEITRLLVLANGHEELAKKLQGSMRIYSDVDTNHWANGVITVGTTKPSEANGIPFLVGYPDGSFQPEKDVTYAELAKMLVVLVKKDLTKEMHDNAIWASSWMTWAAELGILEDVTIADSNAPATRADAFVMMYNALYKMQAFKKVPANEKIGVLSALNKSELVLNQDKEQTYKITDDTVFVNAAEKGDNANVVKVKNIVNPDYYLGSLVRIMINDKNEISHILELGNPEKMALDKGPGYVGENARWKGVADYTVSTGFTKEIGTLADYNEYKDDFKDYAKVKFNKNKTKATSITFYDYNSDKFADHNVKAELNVNSDTKIYVANPYNNIMREVKDMNEALSLIGFNNYEEFRIPNVYAGYNETDIKPVYGAIQAGGYKATAKVVVFNVVTKGQGGDLYRVVRDSSYAGNLTLEDTDGKLYDRDFFKNLAYFPYNYGDFYDVIEVKYYANNNADAIETKIDHSDTEKYPIVKVIKIEDDALVVEDEVQNRTLLDIRDADIFNAKQFKKLAVGDTIQFRVECESSPYRNQNRIAYYPDQDDYCEPTNKAEIISILGDVKMKGTLDGVVPYAQKEQAVGTIVRVTGLDDDNTFATVEIDVYYDLFDSGLGKGIKPFEVDKDVARALVKYQNAEDLVAFKHTDIGYAKLKAYDFRINDVFIDPIEDPNKEAVDAYKDAVQELVDNYNDDGSGINADNVEQAKKDLADAKELYDAVKIDDRDQVKAQKDIYDAIEQSGNVEKAEKQKKYNDFVEKAKAVKVEDQDVGTAKADLEDAVETAVEALDGLPAGAAVTATAKEDVVEGENKVSVVVDANDADVTNAEAFEVVVKGVQP